MGTRLSLAPFLCRVNRKSNCIPSTQPSSISSFNRLYRGIMRRGAISLTSPGMLITRRRTIRILLQADSPVMQWSFASLVDGRLGK